jgi:hypothetical protein
MLQLNLLSRSENVVSSYCIALIKEFYEVEKHLIANMNFKTLGFILLFWSSVIICSTAQNVPTGYVSNVDSNGTVYGWAEDPDSLGTPIQVYFYRGGLLLGSTTADIYHSAAIGFHGFRFTIPETIRASAFTLTVKGVDVTGDGVVALPNGNPYPATINVASNDNSLVHSNTPYQVGPIPAAGLAGGRTNNKQAAFEYKRLSSALWIASGLPWWQDGRGSITVTLSTRLAGGICSVQWDNVEMIDSGAHGTAFQYITHDSSKGELYNPTEGGSNADDCWAFYNTSVVNLTGLTPTQNPSDPHGGHLYQHGSSSATMALNLITGGIHAKSRMAFWAPKNPVPQYGGDYPKPTNTIYNAYHCL